MIEFIEHFIETLIFRSRWVLAPMYLSLVGGLVILMVKFAQEFMHIVVHIFSAAEQDVVLSLLALVDMTLVARCFDSDVTSRADMSFFLISKVGDV